MEIYYQGLIYFVIFFNIHIFANYVKEPSICGNPKCKVPAKFNYHPHTKYKYKYTVTVNTKFDGAGSNSSNLYLSALVSVTFRSQCEAVLKIKNAHISHSSDQHTSTLGSKSEQFDQGLSKYMLRFYFEDGIIAQICPHDNEPIWALNLKKGILSSFQNTMERFDVDQHTYETDINGNCLVRYSFNEVNGTTLALIKQMQLASCSNRHQLYSIIPLTPYVFQKKYHKWTPINSTSTCTQSIDHKVYKSIICEEEHGYQPFYNQTNEAKTSSRSKLTLVVERPSSNFELDEINSLGLVLKRESLLFDHRRPVKATHDNLYECKKSIILLCQLSQTVEFQPMYPDVFNKLIHTARDLTVQAMSKLYKESWHICPTGRKHLKDALPYIRNRASTKLMTDIILSKEISEERRHDWLLIMSFFPRPDSETIDFVSKLMEQKSIDGETMLALSTMVHSYCQSYQNCEENLGLQRVILVLENLFNTTCVSSNAPNEITYIALKSIGNAGVLTKTLLESLNSCIQNEELPTDLRLTSLQAMRRLSCESNNELAINIFRNQTGPEELRIAAYLHIMRCPSYTIINIVKDVLDKEESNQVGSYVWSHLKTQMISALPNRVDIQAMLQDESLTNKFDKDFRTFSKNYEYSFYLNNYGVGVFYETNIIFSHRSYIPRNIVTNVTLIIFGENINIMEINTNVEGIEHYVEKVFAESGTFNKDSISNILKIVRVAREQPNPYNYLIKNIPFKAIIDQIKVSLSIKMFGNELRYYKIRGHAEFVNVLERLNPMNFIRDFLGGQELTYEKSTMLIDTSYVTPMSTGLPLKLNVIGTALVNINAMGLVNASMLTSKNALEVNGRLYPSVGLNFEGTMDVDAFFTQTGIRFKGTVFTSTAIEGNFLMDTYKLIRLSFNLPLQKSYIIHAESELHLVTDQNLIKLEGPNVGRQKRKQCTWDILDEIVGLKLCATSLFPDTVHLLQSPLLLFSGPINFELFLEKTDPSATMYIVQYQMLSTQTNKTILKFQFLTPGSVTKRGMTAEIELDTQSQNITVAYSSTRSQVLAQGYYRNSPQEKLLNFSLDINGKKHIDIQIGVDIIAGKYGNTYYPKLLFAINDKRIVCLLGTIKWVAKKGISQCDIDIDFQTNRFETIIRGYLRLSDASFGTDIKMDYRFGNNGQRETVVVELQITDKSTKFLKYYVGQLRLESTAYAYINSMTTLKFQKAQNHIDCHLDMVTSAKDSLRVGWSYEHYKAFTMNKLNTSLIIFKPNSNIDFKVGFIKKETSANITTVFIVRYATGKEIITTFDLNIPHGTLFYCESRLRITLHAAVEQMLIFTKIWEKSSREYDLEFTGTWFSGHNLTIRGMYQEKSSLILASHSLKFLARSQLFNDILFNGRLINSEDEYKNDIQVEHNDIHYGLIVRHTSVNVGFYESYCQVIYNTSMYSATSQFDVNKRKLTLDLHFDQYRDVYITVHGRSNKTVVDTGLDIKWDVNRDPASKLAFIFQTYSSGKLNHEGRCTLEYPGRVITSSFYVLRIGLDYIFSLRANWSPKDALKSYFQGTIDLQKNGIMKFKGNIETPFQNWEKLGMDYQLLISNQMAKSNGSLTWQKGQKLDGELSYNYFFNDEKSEIFFVIMMNSTIPTVPSLKAMIKHLQFLHEFNSELIIQTSPTSIISASSSGKAEYHVQHSKYFVTVSFETPFLTLRKSSVSAQLNFYNDNKINGIIHLIGNGKKYITTMEASLKYWNESRIIFHISTPFEKYKVLTGKFSFSASKKHLLFDLRSSSMLLGAELVYIYNNITNFDLKLRTQTSFIFVNSVLGVAKINSDTIDLRIGWNTLLIGLIGSSHFSSFTDVDYSVQIFTPIEGYNRGSAIAKFIYSDRLDFEASVSLAERKVGLKIQAMSKPDEDFATPYTPQPILVSSNATQLDSDQINKTNMKQEISNNQVLQTPKVLDQISVPLSLNETPPGIVYWRGMFQLNTPLYPTVHGVSQMNKDQDDYNFITFLSFPFGQLKLIDDLTLHDLINIQNELKLETTCECLKEVVSSFNVKGSHGVHINSEMDVAAGIYDKTYRGNSEFLYDYFSLSEESTEGVYNVTLLLKSPFKMLKHAYLSAHLVTENPNYVGNINIEVNNNSVSLDGAVEIDENYLVSNLGANINSSFFSIPMCRVIINKDFTDIEKKLNLGLALPNERGDALVNYSIGGMWQYETSNSVKCALEINTPYPAIGKIRGSIEFTNDTERKISYLEGFLEYSNKTEVKANCILDHNSIRFNVDYIYDTFKKNINGTFLNKGNSQNWDAVFSSDGEYKLLGWANVITNSQFMGEVKVYKTKDNKEIVSSLFNILKRNGGYEINTLLKSHGHALNLEWDYIYLGHEGKQFDMKISTSYPGYESLSLTAIILNKNYELLIAKIKTDIISEFMTTDVKVDVNIAFKEEAGIFYILLQTPNLFTEIKLNWLLKWIEHLLLDLEGKVSVENSIKTLLTHFHFWNVNSAYNKMSVSADINYNNDFWWVCTNATILWPIWNDLQLASYIIMPNSGIDPAHRLLGKFQYKNDFSYATHIINYNNMRNSTGTKFDFETLSELTSSNRSTIGAFLVKTGKHRIFDRFSIKKSGVRYKILNLLQSTNMKHDLLLELFYKNPKLTQHVNLVLFYPKPTTLVKAYLNFTSIKNLYARMNCSTPFKAFPEIQSYLNIVTNKDFYQRLADIKWLKNEAIFNFTQIVTWLNKMHLTDGKILLEFPLTTKHVALLHYTYESSNMKAIGQSSLFYNGNRIMSGNYTRYSEFTSKLNKDQIVINVDNDFVPAGIIYNHKLHFLDSGSRWNSQDIKSIELFRLNNKTNFSITGEIEFSENKFDKLTTLKAFHSRRKLIIETLSVGKKNYITTANFTLKPNVWFAGGWKLIKKEGTNGQELECNISYTRRLFSISGEYNWINDDLFLRVTANPNIYKKAKSLTGIAQWNYTPKNNSYNVAMIIAHPSLIQNITLVASYFKNESIISDLGLSIKYAKELNRKVTMNIRAAKDTKNPNKRYAINFLGNHPASRLTITGDGELEFARKLLLMKTNVTYFRSYMPMQFWLMNAEINFLKHLINIQRQSLRDSTDFRLMYGRKGSRYFSNGTIYKDSNLTVISDFYIDLDEYKTELSMNFTSDATQRLRMHGSYDDNRDLRLIVWRTVYTFDINDFKISAKLNNSRLFTSLITWRPEIRKEITNFFQEASNNFWKYAVDTANFWTQYTRSEIMDSFTDVWFDAKPMLQDFLRDLRDLKNLQQDIKYFEQIFNESYAANEFYMQDIYEMYQVLTEDIAFKDKMSHVPKIVNELWEVMGETGETIRQSVLWLVESVKNIYEKIVQVLNGLATGETMDQITKYLQGIAGQYDKIIKDMHISFLHYMEEIWNETGNVVAQYWVRTLRTIEPVFIQFAHHIESAFWEGSKKALEFLYEKQSELMRSTVFKTNSNFTRDMERFYDDITKNNFITNLKKYTKMLYDVVTEKYFTSVPFGYELNEIGAEIAGEVKELYNLPVINFTLHLYRDLYKQITWLYNYLKVQERVQTIIPIVYNVIKNYSNTALDNEMNNYAARTKFIFKPEIGQICLEQLLPIPWHAFNETPNFGEIPEYKTIATIHKFFAPTNRTFWTYYYYFAPVLDSSNWLPPFSAQSLVIGTNRLITFDGVSYNLPNHCSFLLAKDYVFETFSLMIISKDNNEKVIALMVHDKILNIDLTNNVISMENEGTPSLPLTIKDLFIYAQEGLLTATSSRGFYLRCNFKFNVCTFRLSGWYFGKVAGLLGTMDNEPWTDFTASNQRITKDLNVFINSWTLSSCSFYSRNSSLLKFESSNTEVCSKLYSTKTSTFAPCYSIINPGPFYTMCLQSDPTVYNDEICTSAYAYIQACSNNYIPIKIPTFCVECPVNTIPLEEGDFVFLDDESVLQSTDVVFIVEAKQCNEYMRERRMVSTFITILTKELEAVELKNNRYALVSFGGDGIFDQPRSILINNQIFTVPKELPKYFEKILTGNGNTDIFGALRFATKLQFRAGVSKTFILVPCSDCDISNMTVEYGVLNQELIEKNITLHILVNVDFDLEKFRVNKMFYGLDSERAYTKNDFKILKGDIELRRQIKLTKSMMGYCTTLALETNGTIFTGKKMGSENVALVKKFSSVFARRIAATAQPDSCQTCECASDNDGIEYIDCVPCSIPIPAYSDFDFNENSSLSIFQTFEHTGIRP